MAAAAVAAVGLNATGLAAQSTEARAAFDAYVACEEASATATTVEAFLVCYAPESRMAQLGSEVVLDVMRTGPVPLTKSFLVEHREAEMGLELRIRGLLDSAPAGEIVVMREGGGGWQIFEVRTLVYAAALTSASDTLPLRFTLSIDGQRVLDESSAVVRLSNAGFPSLVVTPMFEDGLTLQIDNLRAATPAQRFTKQPASAILADPGLFSAEIRGGGIPLGGRTEGQLSIQETGSGVTSGKIRLLVSDLVMDQPVDVVFAFENLALPE